MSVAFKNVTKRFANGVLALDKLKFEFSTGEFIIFLGPSGSGKTTACRCLAGLEEISSGQVLVDGKDITHLPPRERNMSMVFQNYALYSHKIVYENIAYPLRIRKYPKQKIDQMVRDVAKLLQIDDYLGRKPRHLSGGQAQRVAVARALVWQPSICLMDEPLSNLDAILRLQTRTELKRLHEELKCTFVFVTHDQEEAMTLGTRIIVLNNGRLIQFDTPKKIYTEPATRFVAEFIGRPAMNTIEGEISNGTFNSDPLELPIADRAAGQVVLGIRPEHIVLQRQPQSDFIPFTLDVMELVQPDTLLFAKKRKGDPVSVVVRVVEDCSDLRSRDTIYLKFPPDNIHFFDIETGKRLP